MQPLCGWQSARGLAHSKTLRESGSHRGRASVSWTAVASAARHRFRTHEAGQWFSHRRPLESAVAASALPAHSKTPCESVSHRGRGSVLDCGGPPPLFPRSAAVSQTSRSAWGLRGLLRLVLRTQSRSGPKRNTVPRLRLLRGLRATGFPQTQVRASRQNLMAWARSVMRSEPAGTLYPNSMVAWIGRCPG